MAGWEMVVAASGVLSALWAVGFLRTAWLMAVHPSLDDDPPGPRDRWPSVSIVVTARDEVGTLGPALGSLLALDYPELELVVVDDRSSDGTGELLRQVAAADPRVRIETVRELPDGWLGKVHALERGLRRTSGRWVLFTDADVHFHPGALRRAVHRAERLGLDHLTCLPGMHARSFWLEVTSAAFGSLLLAQTWVERMPRAGSRVTVGAGAFNLFRRATLDRTPGLAALRLEVADDFALARLLKSVGARAMVVFGVGQVELEWYPDLPAMIRGLEKNMFPHVARYRYSAGVAAALLTAVYAVAPVVAMLQPTSTPVRAIGVVAYGAALLCGAVARRRFGYRFAPALGIPVGLLMVAWALLRSTVMCAWRGGILWRGTLYPVAMLRRGSAAPGPARVGGREEPAATLPPRR